MKKTFGLIVILIVIITSCTTVRFETSMPKNTDELKEFPSAIIGKYVDQKSEDTIIINTTYFESLSKKDAIKHDAFEKITLSDSVVLKKYKDYLVLNLRKNADTNWDVILIEPKKNKLYVYSIFENKKEEKFMKNLKGITRVSEMVSAEDSTKHYLLNPTNTEFGALIKKGLFSKIYIFKKIK